MERLTLTKTDLVNRYKSQVDLLRAAGTAEGRKAIARELEFTRAVAASLFSVKFAEWLEWNFPEIVTDDWRKECEKRNQRAAIRNCSKDFAGKMSDERCMKWLNLSETVFYQRKKELLSGGIG